MYSDPSATFSGKEMGTGVVRTGGQALDELKAPERAERRTILSREEPFALTIIIGGTNVRFCISRPGDPEPLTCAVKWQELSDELCTKHKVSKSDFINAHNIVYPILAERFITFLKSHFDPRQGPLPIENLCALTFSIAGRVFGDEREMPGLERPINGIDAEVSTTNTGLKFSKEKIGRVFYDALKAVVPELRFPSDDVIVLNDARAGLEGEKILQSLPVDTRMFFEIGGTGEGADYDYPGFDEIGHRTIIDRRDKKIVVLVGDEINPLLEADGSFRNLPEHQEYAENLLAGPWVAIRFVKSIDQKPEVMVALAHWIEAKLQEDALKNPENEKKVVLSAEEILPALYKLANLQFTDRTRWAIDSNSLLTRKINDLIFQPDHRAIRRAMPCSFQVEPLEQTHPEKALILLAWARQKTYLKDRGTITGKIYRAMAARGVQPDKYILGGGLGEMFNRYNTEDRQDALDLIIEHAKLPPGIFDFSRVSPEARESALSYAATEKAKKERDALKAVSKDSVKFPH